MQDATAAAAASSPAATAPAPAPPATPVAAAVAPQGTTPPAAASDGAASGTDAADSNEAGPGNPAAVESAARSGRAAGRGEAGGAAGSGVGDVANGRDAVSGRNGSASLMVPAADAALKQAQEGDGGGDGSDPRVASGSLSGAAANVAPDSPPQSQSHGFVWKYEDPEHKAGARDGGHHDDGGDGDDAGDGDGGGGDDDGPGEGDGEGEDDGSGDEGEAEEEGGGGEGDDPAGDGDAAVEGATEGGKVAAGPQPLRPLKPGARRAVDQMQIKKIKELGAHQLDLELQRQTLELGAQALVLKEELKRRSERVTRAEALRRDERLGSLPAKKVLSELTAASPGRGHVSLDAFVAARRAVLASPGGAVAAAAAAAAGGPGPLRGGGGGGAAEVPPGAGPGPSRAAELLSALRTRWDPEEDDAEEEGEEREAVSVGGGGGDPSAAATTATRGSAALPAIAPNVRLDDLVSALRYDMPGQQLALRELKMQRDIDGVRLGWARRLGWAPEDEEGAGGDGDGGDGEQQQQEQSRQRRRRRRPLLLLDVRSRELRQMALEILDEALERTMQRLVQRPSRELVVSEVAAWRATQPAAMAGLARHLAEGLTHEVVDELIAEAFDEIRHLKEVADTFAFDLLVEAVAFSQRKYSFGAGRDNVRARLRDAAVQQDAQLARSVAAKRAATMARSLSRAATIQARTRGAAGGGGGGGGDGGDTDGDADGGGDADEYSLYARRSMAVAAARGFKLGDALSADLDEEAVYVIHREFNDTQLALEEKQLYLQGLKAMLQEMRSRRGDAPYGHTQQLSVYWPPYVRVTRAQRLAVQRVRPPLAAGPSVWRQLLRDAEPAVRCPAAPWPPGPDTAVATGRERLFWAQVAMRPTHLTAKGLPMAQVFRDLGPVTCLSASPNGAFLALGTAPGALLVFQMRGPPVAPWFQVTGDGPSQGQGHQGQAPGRPALFRPRQRLRNQPAIVAFSWSADSCQLASLDVTSTLRMWWMRPEPGTVVKEDPGRQPVVPELILSIGPMSMAISGKAPVMEPMLDEHLAAATAAAGNPTGGAAAAAAAAAATQAAALSRRWALCFHPEFNITGVQPTVMLPQVTGDLVRLTSRVGSRVLPAPLPRSRGRPVRSRLGQQTVDFLMPPQIPAPESRQQALLRGHDSHIVFVGVMADCASVVSVDASGEINLWPTFEGDRTGYGWFVPRRTWRMPRTLRSYQARGPLNPVWPRVPVPALRDIRYNPPSQSAAAALQAVQQAAAAAGGGAAAGTGASGGGAGGGDGGGGGGGGPFAFLRGLFRRRDRNTGGGGGGAAAAATGGGRDRGGGGGGGAGPSVASSVLPPVVSYSEMLADEGMLDDEYEAVRLDELPLGDFLLETRQLWLVRFLLDRNGRLLREAIHRPVGQNPLTGEAGGGGRPLVVSTFTMDGELVRRAKQYVLNVEEGFKPSTPRIDIYDHSRGAAPPAFAVSHRVSGLGSEYLVVGLAHGLLGFFSLSTGAIVRVVQLPGIPTPSPYFSCLTLFTVSPNAGECANAGKSFVAVTPVHAYAAHVYELDDSGGVALNVRAVAAYAPPPGAAPPPPPEPVLPAGYEPPPVDDDGGGGGAAAARDPLLDPSRAESASGATAAAAAAAPPPEAVLSVRHAWPAEVGAGAGAAAVPAAGAGAGGGGHRVAFSVDLPPQAAVAEAAELPQGRFLPPLARQSTYSQSRSPPPLPASEAAAAQQAAAPTAGPAAARGGSADGRGLGGRRLPTAADRTTSR
ncbi:hypothetical protein PLESTF_001319000 [Pleodorina starrii]|nr:hypothetical protein PLESTF_001319000 [Pleodorina starrii]